MSDDPRARVRDTKLIVTVAIFGSVALAALLGPIAGPAAWLLLPLGVGAGIALAVRGVAGAHDANRRLLDARFGVLGLVAEPHGMPGGLRYRGVALGRHVEAYQVTRELYVAVGAGTRTFAAFSSPARAIGEQTPWPPMHALPLALSLPPGTEAMAQDHAALQRLIAVPGVDHALAALFQGAHDPRWRRVWISPGGVHLRDAMASLPDAEHARRLVELLAHVAGAAEHAQL